MPTASGRVLTGTLSGPADGQVVLFVAGAATGRSMSFGTELLDELEVRLLTMDRPGMGGSTPDGARTIASTADDYRVLASAVLGHPATGVPVVANSQGSVFGLAIGLAGWASGLVLVSPADEIAHPAIHAMLPAEATALADLAGSAPEDARQVLSQFDAAAMENMVLAGSGDADQAFYSAPAFRDVYRAALHEGFANDGAGYVEDTLLAMRPWGLDLGALTCPVSMLFGADDRSHSPDLGATLASRIPACERDVVPDAGGALLWTHADLVLDRARRAPRSDSPPATL